MRYPDGGGLDAAERARREQVRLACSLSRSSWLADERDAATACTHRRASCAPPTPGIGPTMTNAATHVPLSEAKARLFELARRVHQQHERITLTRNGEPEAVLLSVYDLEGLEMTLEVLGNA